MKNRVNRSRFRNERVEVQRGDFFRFGATKVLAKVLDYHQPSILVTREE